ncbi:MAG: BrnT family toxin [Pseudomonadota bacterium]
MTLGRLDGRSVVIVHTPRADGRRIISMRKANNCEQKIYHKRLDTN